MMGALKSVLYIIMMLSTFWWSALSECLVYNHDVVYILVGAH